MKYTLIATIALLAAAFAKAQDEAQIAAIVAEGKNMYRSEMASWYGTDLFLEKFKDQRTNIGGYFSYADKERTNCIFFSNAEHPVVLAVISFDSTYSVSAAQIDSRQRDFNETEDNLYRIRKKAVEEIKSDTMFQAYPNTSLNLIPMINGDERKVFVLTGPETNGTVLFGNDYLLTFDAFDNVISKRKLHRNMIPIEYESQGNPIFAAMHNHLPETGDYITSTDICTLMLYQHLPKWQQHYVISEHFVSIWDCNKNELVVLTKEAWDKMNESGKKKNKKRN
jgi:hypothetical protein